MISLGLFNYKKDVGIFDKYKSISIERVNNFLNDNPQYSQMLLSLQLKKS